ncbi:MAG TPA: hypothetical protein VLK23_15345 [Thermodesulfobacteriota bacterium]|nr:hypothetical protein [Thermodesulfobacteriota bacterium]
MEESNLKKMRTQKSMKGMAAMLVLTLTCIGCVYGGYNGTQSTGSRVDNLKIGANHPVLVMGSMFTYQDTTLSGGKIYKVTTVMVIEEKKEFEKKIAYWIDVKRKRENYLDSKRTNRIFR